MTGESGMVPRGDQGNAFAFVAPVNPKICINRNDRVLWVKFAHPDQAQIGKIRLTILVTHGEFFDLTEILLQIEDKP